MSLPIAAKMVPGDSAFQEAASKVAQALRERQVTFFAGAGVSQPSGLPGSPGLMRALVDAMVESLSITGVGQSADHREVEAVISVYPLEQLLNALVGTNGDDAALTYLSVLQGAPENYNHTAIAVLADRGELDCIVTLNFDVLFEQALRRRSVSFAWHLPLAGDGQIPPGPAQVAVVKPHGTLPFDGFPYERHFLAATLSYAGDRPQQETARVLKETAQRRPVLVVAGYNSKADWDIFPILSALPWSQVIWCEYVSPENLSNPSSCLPYEPVRKWLLSRPPASTSLLFGDARNLWSTILADRKITDAWPNQQERVPDALAFLRFPGRTALAALHLLDGKANDLYRRFLPPFGTNRTVTSDPQLLRQWERSMSWFYHAHENDIRTAIRIRRRLLEQRSRSSKPDLEQLGDLLRLYDEHLSAAQRLYFLWPVDLLGAYNVAKLLRKEAPKLEASGDASPWTRKQAKVQVGHLRFYWIDFLHNWGYFLLPFDKVAKGLCRVVFRSITKLYGQLIHDFPVFDWEYHLVRRVEAALIAYEDQLVQEAEQKLKANYFMFVRTGGNRENQQNHEKPDHLAYLRAVQAIIEGSKKKEKFDKASEKEFLEAAKPFLDPLSTATPSGKLRMRLLHRYFWPQSVPVLQMLRDFVRYSRVQR